MRLYPRPFLPVASNQDQTPANGHDVRRSATWDIAAAPRNYATLLLAQGGTALLSFTTVWLINRSSGAGAYGDLIAFVAVSQLVQVFLNWSLTALTRFGIEEFVATGRVTRSFWSRTMIFIPKLAIALVTSPLWLGPLTGAFRIAPEVSWLVLVHIVATSLWLHVQYTLQSVKMMRLQAVLLVIERIVVLGMAISFLRYSGLTQSAILWCFILPPAVMAVVGLAITARFVGPARVPDQTHLRTMMRFSLPLIPYAIIGYFTTNQLDAYFLNRYTNTADLGVYSVAAQISGLVIQVPLLANTLLLSMFVSIKSGGDESSLKRLFADLVPSATLAWCLVCAALALVGSLLIPVVFGPAYEPAGRVLWVLMASAGLGFPILFGLATLSNTYSKTYISMFASGLAAVVNVLLDIILIPKFGLTGCAWATVIASVISLSVFVALLRREQLLPASWILLAVVPIVLSSAVLTFSANLILTSVCFAILLMAIAAMKASSLMEAAAMLKRKLHA